MSIEEQISNLAFEANAVNQTIETGKLNSDFKNQWSEFYQILRSFAATDPATLTTNAVFAETEIDKFKSKLNTWKNAALAASEAFVKSQSGNLKTPLLIGGGVIAILGLVLLSRRS